MAQYMSNRECMRRNNNGKNRPYLLFDANRFRVIKDEDGYHLCEKTKNHFAKTIFSIGNHIWK
jgi:hypothetical protein